MNDDKYPIHKLPEIYYYEFISEGPKGNIKKVVRYSLITEEPNLIFNLGFGDWDKEMNDVDDIIKTNNQDSQKVLATVADTVIDFTYNNPDASIFAQGSTPSRTRFYQMGIANFFAKIDALFTIVGYKDERWLPFEKGINYEAFLIKRK